MVKPNVCAVSCGTPSSAMRWATGPPSSAPEKAPESTAIRVMPLCTVDRKRPGSASRSSAVWAPCRPARAMARRRVRRDETIASSDMARAPLRITNSRMRMTSHQGKGASGREGGIGVRAFLAAKGRARQWIPPPTDQLRRLPEEFRATSRRLRLRRFPGRFRARGGRSAGRRGAGPCRTAPPFGSEAPK